MAVTVTLPADLPAALAAGHSRLRALLPTLSDEALRGPSVLPGWTRGHVLTHIEGVGLALARQARYALRDKLIDVYDGGRPARDAAIEAGHRRPVQQFVPALSDALDEIEASWAPVGADDWDRPVRYRDGVLRDAALSWWREVEIHTADADLGYGTEDWPAALCTYLIGYLAPRVPGGFHVTLTATDSGEEWSFGSGTPLAVTGRAPDLAAWLAGRVPAAPLGGDPLPRLGEWP